MDELALVENAAKGDADKFSKLVDIYYGRVFLHALKRMGNRWGAEEVTQETFLKAYIGLGKLNNAASFAPWLYTICNNEVNLFYENLYKERRVSGQAETVVKGNFPAPKPGKREAILYSAVDSLKPELREVVVLKYFSGFRMREISYLQGIPEKRVKSRLFEARSRLRELMASNTLPAGSPGILAKRRKQIMDRVKLMDAGAYVFTRMSLAAQKDLFECAKENGRFTESVLQELGRIDRGREFVELCNGSISFEELVLILACCDNDAVRRFAGAVKTPADNKYDLLAALKKYGGAGYLARGLDVMLNVKSVEDTVEWYKRVLGWNGELGVFDEEGKCTYACATPEEMRGVSHGNRTFQGFHLSLWDTCDYKRGFSAMITVIDIEGLRKKVVEGGWEKVSEIVTQPWGARTLFLEDLNGYNLIFLEWLPQYADNPYVKE